MRQQASIAALSLSLAGISVLGGRAQTPAAANLTAFHLLEATIDDVQAAFQAKRLTCRALVELYLRRIDAYDKAGPSLNAVQTVNPHALREADRLPKRPPAEEETGTSSSEE